MSAPERQPSHLAIAREISAIGARMDSHHDEVNRRFDAGEHARADLARQVQAIAVDVGVLKQANMNREIADKEEKAHAAEPPPPPPKKTWRENMVTWLPLFVGLPTIALVGSAMLKALQYFADLLTRTTP